MLLAPPANYKSTKSCWHCIHFKTEGINEHGLKQQKAHCDAFPMPNGIPTEIYNKGHNKPRHDLGQVNDIVFEPDKEKIKLFKKKNKKPKREAKKIYYHGEQSTPDVVPMVAKSV